MGGGVPKGGIIMWSGSISDIPKGWALCDGTNGTPNLQNRFVLGAGDLYEPNETGGVRSKTLSTANLPSHTHSLSGGAQTISVETVSHGIAGRRFLVSSGYNENRNIDVDINLSGNVGRTGSGASFSIMPPYYALAFIMKL